MRYKDQPLPPNSKQIITSSTNTSSTPPPDSLSSQITPSAQPLSAQSTAPSQSTLSSQPALSSQQALSTSTLPEQVNNPQIHMQSTTTTQKSETLDILEQEKKCQPALSKPESESSQPPATSEKAEKSQSSTIMQSELAQPAINLVQAEDKFLSDAPPTLNLNLLLQQKIMKKSPQQYMLNPLLLILIVPYYNQSHPHSLARHHHPKFHHRLQ